MSFLETSTDSRNEESTCRPLAGNLFIVNCGKRFLIHGCVDVRYGHQEAVGGQSRNRSLANTKIGQGNVRTLRRVSMTLRHMGREFIEF